MNLVRYRGILIKVRHLINKLKKFQTIFLRFYAYKSEIFNQTADIIANFAGLKSLKTRRLVFTIDCPELLKKNSFKIPLFYSRYNPLFTIPQFKTPTIAI